MVNRIKLLNQNEASEQSQELLNQAQKKFGKIPNVFKMMSNSSAVLRAYFDFSGALAQGKLDPQIQERIGLLIAEKNGCEYCLAAHSMISKGAGLSEEEIMLARKGKSNDKKADAALLFAAEVFEYTGDLDDATLNKIRLAGFSDEEILEIAAAVSLNILTNSLNNIAHTQVDFPKAKECSGCSCGCSN
ncbi:MAG TPA: carboxymuconolactone decarboxylase family protein [Candidatus Gastranaerophilales bacterium]|nr:carboxymuconolactone decarboxylase family protein [Candidatus Gastranaerophilales bacterium]